MYLFQRGRQIWQTKLQPKEATSSSRFPLILFRFRTPHLACNSRGAHMVIAHLVVAHRLPKTVWSAKNAKQGNICAFWEKRATKAQSTRHLSMRCLAHLHALHHC